VTSDLEKNQSSNFLPIWGLPLAPPGNLADDRKRAAIFSNFGWAEKNSGDIIGGA
jgi:hypothetical protein